MTRHLLLWPLIVLLPFAGIRMVCVERPGAGAADVEANAHCGETCPLPKPANRQAPADETGTGCLLFADGSLHLLVSGPAVLPAPPPVHFAMTTLRFEPEVDPLYFGPALAHGTPPPKA